MKRCNILLSATTLLACAVLAGPAAAQQKTLKEQLLGSWTLVSQEITAKDGTKTQEFGPNPKGILILDASGRYAQVMARADRPKFKPSENLRLDTPAAEYAEAARAFAGNFGTWSVNEADKMIVRKYEGALIPNVEGQENKLSVSLSGNDLKLSTTMPNGAKVDLAYKR